MPALVRSISARAVPEGEFDPHLHKEWLVTNGLGGYASGTVTGVLTRRYHGLLIAGLPSPYGRTMMLNSLTEQVRLPDRSVFAIVANQSARETHGVDGHAALKEFRLEMGLPVWTYDVGGHVLEKRVLMLHGQNTVHVSYRLQSGPATVRLGLRPAVQFRSHDASVSASSDRVYRLQVCDEQYEIQATGDLPPLRLRLHGKRTAFTTAAEQVQLFYKVEENRGYDYKGELWSPGFFRADLAEGADATLVASTEAWETVEALAPLEAARAEQQRRSFVVAEANPKAREGLGAELVLAADAFIISPAGRMEDAARARATGDEVRTVIAGYHWFTDWGRDTMISLEGLTLTTGRHMEAGWILRTFAHYVREGLIPNMFPEGEKQALYHAADATLWYFHALHRYLEATNDRATLRLVLPRLRDIAEHHLRGTAFAIGVDPKDGLLKQGAPGYQLTWMDAKVDDWVVTPRRGKAVEINALWYNALCLLARWLREEQSENAARPFAEHAERARDAFNRRFWYGEGGYLYDVVDGEHGDDASCRPNQVLSISLDHPVLDRARWEAVMHVINARLLTPFGLRTLAPGSRDYKAKYYGDLRARDAAYHQGTVWPWLIGPFLDAWMKLHPEDRSGAHKILEGFDQAMNQQCIGSVAEIFDAEAPYVPRGCIAQAWSVAEVLRSWVKTA